MYIYKKYKKMNAVGLELVDHVYSATNDPSAALPTAPR